MLYIKVDLQLTAMLTKEHHPPMHKQHQFRPVTEFGL